MMKAVKRYSKAARLAEQLKAELMEERFSAEKNVYSVRKLACRYGISPATADQILRQLTEEDFLYRIPNKGTFIRYKSPVSPPIGYAGPLFSPREYNTIRNIAVRHMQEYLVKCKINPYILTYHELLDRKLAEKKLEQISGLLISVDFVDSITIKNIQEFNGPIVMIGNYYFHEELSCSQVISDPVQALTEFSRSVDLDFYEKILIISAEHLNAKATSRKVKTIFCMEGVEQSKIETIELQSNLHDKRMISFLFFSQQKRNWEKTLVVFTSGHYAMGMLEYFRCSKAMPDVLSIDNLEGYMDATIIEPYFTAIDRRSPDIYKTGVDLLLELITKKDERHHVIQIPSHLIWRKSVRHLLLQNVQRNSISKNRKLQKEL